MNASPSRPDLHVGKTLDGRYVVEDVLGEGGMGVVYRGRHAVIDKRVAIKILRGALVVDAEMVERFLNEARAASSIGNPHIVDVSDFGQLEDGARYFVMEYLDGPSLADVKSAVSVLPIPRLIHIAKQVARALGAAHARGIVHRDLKPDNIMLVVRGDDPDFVKILDFGIAKVTSEAGQITRAGTVFGTPHYMSPEQAEGGNVDARTDVYALGIILYEMASGRVPFDADNYMGILTQHVYKAPLPFQALVPPPAQPIPAAFEAIVRRCIAKRPDERYASMEALVADLDRCAYGLALRTATAALEPMSPLASSSSAAFSSTGSDGSRSRVRYVLVATLALATVSAIGAALIILLKGEGRHPPAPTSSSAPPVSAPSPAAPSAANAPTSSAAIDPAPPARISVLVTVDPADAVVRLDDGAAGPQPVTVTLGVDGRATLHIERKGYVAQTVVLEGHEIDTKSPWRLVTLVKEKPTAVAPPPKPAKPAGPPAPIIVKPPPPPPAKPAEERACQGDKIRNPFTKKCE